MKNSFILYGSYSEQINLLDDAECGRLFKALFAFNATGEMPSLSGGAMMAFSFITSQMSRDAEEYEKVCEKRREAGKKGGRPPKSEISQTNDSEEKAKKANGFFEKQTKAKKPDNDTDDVNDTDDDKDIIKSTSYSLSETRANMRRVIAAWNTLGSLGIQPVLRIDTDSKRAKALKARIAEYGAEKVLEAVENVRQSDFLQGKTGNGWVITFDWFVKPNNFPKVLEGNYSNREPQKEISSNPFLDYLREEGKNEHYRNG